MQDNKYSVMCISSMLLTIILNNITKPNHSEIADFMYFKAFPNDLNQNKSLSIIELLLLTT